MLRFEDTQPVSGVTMSDRGLMAYAKAARTGIQVYLGKEVGLTGDNANKLVRVYRSEKEVRSPESMQTFSHAPITMDHPAEPVTPQNWADLAKGEVSTEAKWEDNHISLPLIIKDAATIQAVQAGKRQLSVGYQADVVMQDGVSPEGEQYDALQTNIRVNHLAIVQRGRAGTAQIGDSADGVKWGVSPVYVGDAPAQPRKEKSMNTRTIIVDELSVETTDAGAQAIDKLQKQLADANTAHGTKVADLNKTIADRDSRIGELEVENKSLKDAQLDDAAIEARVTERTQLVADAHLVDKDLDCKGKTPAEIRRTTVAKVLGDEAVKDANDDTVKGMFKAVVAQRTADANRDPMSRAFTPTPNAAPVVNDAQPGQLTEDQAYKLSVQNLNPKRAN